MDCRDAHVANKTAIVFPPEDHEQLFKIISEIIVGKYDRCKIAEEGMDFVKNTFELDKVVDAWVAEMEHKVA
jgi:hypothetical protein